MAIAPASAPERMAQPFLATASFWVVTVLVLGDQPAQRVPASTRPCRQAELRPCDRAPIDADWLSGTRVETLLMIEALLALGIQAPEQVPAAFVDRVRAKLERPS